MQMESRYVPTPHSRRLWLEPACGTGRYLRTARSQGINGIGFDLSPEMIAYARARAARTQANAREQYFVGSMTDFASHLDRPISFAFNLINTIRHLGSDAEMLAHFEQIGQALAPRGVYAVGLSFSLYGHEQPSEDVWEGGRGQCRVQQVVQFTPPTRGRHEQVISHLCVTTPEGEDHRTCQYTLRTYSAPEFTELIDRSCLRMLDVIDEEMNSIALPELGYATVVLGRRR